jgi:tetratricopeptide (TPR) repeat protein
MAKIALLIGVGESEGLTPLVAPPNDVETLRRVLEDPHKCGFDQIKFLLNPDPQLMREEIERCFKERNRDDLILLYFSGHGITTEDDNKLYLATSRTRITSLRSTAIEAEYIHKIMNDCRSKRQLIILDCCYSGAFVEGFIPKDDGRINVREQLGGEGRAILTSSDEIKRSYEEENLSIYTRYLVEGIETGAADLDLDGDISVDELHDYIEMQVRQNHPNVKPKFYPVEQGYRIILAKTNVDPETSYSKFVQDASIRLNGRLENFRRQLDQKRQELGITPESASQIEGQILQPYREKENKKQQFKEAVLKMMEVNYITAENVTYLNTLASLLNLNSQEVRKIYEDIQYILRDDPSKLIKLYQLDDNLGASNTYAEENLLGREYYILFELLFRQKNWQEADKQSARILLIVTNQQSTGNLPMEAIDGLPEEVLNKIDKFWLEASDSHFGWSIQAELFSYFNGDLEQMAKCCDWREEDAFFWKGWEKITFDLSAKFGHLPWLAWKNLGNSSNFLGIGTFWGRTNLIGRTPFYQKLLTCGIGQNLGDDVKIKDEHYFYKRGKIKWRLGENEGAITNFNEALAINSQYAEAYSSRGLVYEQIKNYQQARLDYDKALEYDPDNTPLIARQANILYQLGLQQNTNENYEEAITYLKQSLELNPQNADGYEQLALANFRLKSWERVIEYYSQLIQIRPDYLYAYNNRGSAWLNLGNYQTAIADYDQAIELGATDDYPYYHRGLCHYNLNNQEAAIADFTKTIEITSNNVKSYSLRGQIYYQQKNYPLAIEDFTKEIELVNSEGKVEAYFRRGNAYLDGGKYQEALGDYNEVIQARSDYVWVHRNIGIANYHLQQYDLAIKAFDKVLALEPDYYEAYLNKGLTYSAWENYQEAIRNYTFIVEAEVADKFILLQAYCNRGLVYGLLNDNQQTIADCTKALELDEQYADAYWKRGNAYENLQDYEKAISDYDKVIELVPEFVLSFVARGNVQRQLGNYLEALKDYQTALDLKPDCEKSWYVDVHFKIAQAHHTALDYPKALKKYQEIIETLEPENLASDINIGLIKYEQGKKQIAINYWKEVLDKSPDNLETQLAIAIAEYTCNGQNQEQISIAKVQEIFKKDPNWSHLEYLQQNLWGSQLLADAEKLFKSIVI